MSKAAWRNMFNSLLRSVDENTVAHVPMLWRALQRRVRLSFVLVVVSFHEDFMFELSSVQDPSGLPQITRVSKVQRLDFASKLPAEEKKNEHACAEDKPVVVVKEKRTHLPI